MKTAVLLREVVTSRLRNRRVVLRVVSHNRVVATTRLLLLYFSAEKPTDCVTHSLCACMCVQVLDEKIK